LSDEMLRSVRRRTRWPATS